MLLLTREDLFFCGRLEVRTSGSVRKLELVQALVGFDGPEFKESPSLYCTSNLVLPYLSLPLPLHRTSCQHPGLRAFVHEVHEFMYVVQSQGADFPEVTYIQTHVQLVGCVQSLIKCDLTKSRNMTCWPFISLWCCDHHIPGLTLTVHPL